MKQPWSSNEVQVGGTCTLLVYETDTVGELNLND